MQSIRTFIGHRPRMAAALAFGISTSALTHFAWYPDERMSGAIPALTLGVGVAHGVAGAIFGARLIDVTRTRTPLHPVLLGTGTSLVAQAMFAPALAMYVFSSNAGQSGALAFVTQTFFTGLFAFLAAGWALLLLSVIVALALNRLANDAP